MSPKNHNAKKNKADSPLCAYQKPKLNKFKRLKRMVAAAYPVCIGDM
ncbi:MAG: hypothetical protein ABIA97_05900 [Candidatus Omnitrophota bacterium]